MNIVLLDKYLRAGGVATFMNALGEGLIEQGHKLYLVTGTDDENKQIIQKFSSNGFTVITLPADQNRLIAFYRFFIAVWQLLKTTEIDIIHSQHRLTHFVAITIGRLFNLPRLLTLHMFKEDNQLLTRLWKNEAMTVPSSALKRHLVNFNGLNADDITVINNTIKSAYKIDRQYVKTLKETSFKNDVCYVTYIGRFSEEKGIDVLLKSTAIIKKQNKNITFRLFGYGPREEFLKKQCDNLNLKTDHIFCGFNEAVNEILYLSDICVLPSRSENFSLFVLECMRAGIPMVASNVGGMPEVIEDGKTGLLVEPGNPEMLAESILKLCHSKTMRNQFSQEARERLANKFSVDDFYQAHIQKYRQVISYF